MMKVMIAVSNMPEIMRCRGLPLNGTSSGPVGRERKVRMTLRKARRPWGCDPTARLGAACALETRSGIARREGCRLKSRHENRRH